MSQPGDEELERDDEAWTPGGSPLDRATFNADGLLPAIIQQEGTGEVLMLGWMDREAMRQAGVSDNDIEQAVRLQAGVTDLSQLRQARLERDGSISVVPADREPKVLDVRVEEGVQTVRLRLE